MPGILPESEQYAKDLLQSKNKSWIAVGDRATLEELRRNLKIGEVVLTEA